ncbi:2OG-Fe(II) oxygenase [Ferruginibacter sp. HRS2-29]|uniref:2OG-Fe(II) oxygenase n=1 Tax=Ferruginibacter sp. HRS2-29 TaxID=2487334 RepID=UPI0020CD07EA|nr:2OG-Fe(II) oxygenase [Ferruginibacter sp. HRS2-29]MCP9751167.1 2OG-Fe(II) oxygenase [Ferruginibacter sp. HRS2-29]
MQEHFDLLIDSFLNNDIGIDTSFLNDKLSKGLQQNIKDLENDNKMIAAGVGNDEVKDHHQKMRGDTIYWMDKSHDNIFEQEFLQLAEDFIGRLNNTCYTGINDYEFHYAVYDEGSFYKRHLDQFKNDDSRKYSLISYLNDYWKTEDGGQLLLHHESGQQSVLPEAGTTVFFKSNELEHEVTLTNRRRMSISGWLKSN